MTIQKLPGSAIVPGTVTVVQLESSVATTVQTGGSPKITAITVTNNSYTNLDDTAVSVAGGYIKITGTGFVTGCSIIIGNLVATSVSFISSTEVRAQVPAQAAGTYTVYLVNPDGGVGIRVNGLNYSSTPTWTTTSPLGDGSIDSAISVQFVATSNSTVTYALQAGSTLPAGLSLSSSGLLTGTVTGITVDTTYNFTVVATDAENQDTPQAFSITITISDPNFKNTVLLLQADTAPTIISDASTNNFDLTVAGDARASSFTPYGTGYSLYTNGSSSYAYLSYSSSRSIGTNDFSIECWINVVRQPANYTRIWSHQSNWGLAGSVGVELAFGTVDSLIQTLIDGNSTTYYDVTASGADNVALYKNRWCHTLVTRQSGILRLFLNGVLKGAVSGATTNINGTSTTSFGTNSQLGGDLTETFISNFRMVIGSVPTSYQTNSTTVNAQIFTPSTSKLTSSSQGATVGDVKLLLFQDNRFIENISNATINLVSSPSISHNNPFYTQIPNGSAYFDGTGDYITVPDNANLEPLGGNFTIETWFYLNAVTAGTQICGKSWWTPFYIEGSNLVTYLSSNGSTWDIASNQVIITSVATFRWYHVAMVRNGTSIKVYVNGTETLSLTSSAALHDGSDTFTIGARGTTYLNGYVADLRFVKGTAVYTANFTPPTSPLTAIANTQLLTLQYRQPHNNHTFLDSSSNQFVVTRNGNTTQGTFSPFSQSGHSVYFDGNGDYLAIADNAALRLGTGDFTIEFYINVGPVGTHKDQAGGVDNYPRVITKGLFGSTTGIDIGYDSTGSKSIYWSDKIGTDAVEPNTWYHVAFTRSGTTWRVFKDGILKGSNTYAGYDISDTREVNIARLGYSNGVGFNHMNCYISNLRIIKGTALYTTNFTPSTTPLTSVANTSLLACHANRFIDGSANNFTVTRNGDARVTAFGPFSTSAYSATSNGGSAYFDGTGDDLVLPINTAFALGTDNFTIEAWIYPTQTSCSVFTMSASGVNQFVFTHNISGTTGGSSNGTAQLWMSTGGGSGIFGPTNAVVQNAWNHIAAVRQSGTVTVYVNGIAGTGVSNTTNVTGVYTPKIGSLWSHSASVTPACYISALRIVKGTAVYTGNFTPPTAPPTAITNTSLLLNCTDAAMRDSRGLAVLETVGDAKTSTVQVKYGTGSMRFDGTGDALVSPYSVNYELGTSNFTIETWFYIAANSAQDANSNRNAAIIETRDAPGTANGMFIIVQGDTTTTGTGISFGIRIGGTTYSYASTGSIAQTTWHHLAVVRSGTTCTTYLNGTSIASNTSFGHDIKSASNMYIGSSPLTSFPRVLNGYLNDLRITRGIARYTANFTPPATKFLAR